MVVETASLSLPVGYHFSPSDEELVEYYLAKKVRGEALSCNVIPEVDLYGNEAPWELFPWNAGAGRDRFVVFTRLKRLSKKRVSRTSSTGEWHGNTSGAPIFNGKQKEIGRRRQYTFKVKKGKEGGGSGRWIMHEFSLAGSDSDVVLCEIENKEKKRPRVDDVAVNEERKRSRRTTDEEGCLSTVSSSSSSNDLPLTPSTEQFVEQMSNQHEGKEVVNGSLCCEVPCAAFIVSTKDADDIPVTSTSSSLIPEVESSGGGNGFVNLPEDDFWGDDQFGFLTGFGASDFVSTPVFDSDDNFFCNLLDFDTGAEISITDLCKIALDSVAHGPSFWTISVKLMVNVLHLQDGFLLNQKECLWL